MSTAETPLSAERIEEIRTLRAGITPGPWTADLREPWDMVIWGADGTAPEVDDPQNAKLVMNIGEPMARVGDVCGSEADARFIATAPQIADDCLALAEENARLQAELARLEAIIAAWNGFADDLGAGILEALTPDTARLSSDGARLT